MAGFSAVTWNLVSGAISAVAGVAVGESAGAEKSAVGASTCSTAVAVFASAVSTVRVESVTVINSIFLT